MCGWNDKFRDQRELKPWLVCLQRHLQLCEPLYKRARLRHLRISGILSGLRGKDQLISLYRKFWMAIPYNTCRQVSYFAKAATTKHHRLGRWSNASVFAHSSGLWKSKVKVLEGMSSSEASLLGIATRPLPHHMIIPLGCTPGLSSSSYQDTSPIALAPHLCGLVVA